MWAFVVLYVRETLIMIKKKFMCLVSVCSSVRI